MQYAILHKSSDFINTSTVQMRAHSSMTDIFSREHYETTNKQEFAFLADLCNLMFFRHTTCGSALHIVCQFSDRSCNIDLGPFVV